jgi:PAS fold
VAYEARHGRSRFKERFCIRPAKVIFGRRRLNGRPNKGDRLVTDCTRNNRVLAAKSQNGCRDHALLPLSDVCLVGQELTNLYNDAYRPFLGKKHPEALGQSARTIWAEIWSLIGPRTEAVLDRAESTFDEALLLIMERFGYPEETYFTFSYSPIRNDEGHVGGIFCAVTDETQRVIGERRLQLLREVAATSSKIHTPEQVCIRAAECIAANARDLPFTLLYLVEHEGKNARLAAQAGADRD